MNRLAIRILLCVVGLLLVGRPAVHAQGEAGTVAAVIGKLQIQRAGTWQDARVGVPVFVGDRLRTGAADRAKVVFRDDSVLDVAAKTEISIDKQVFDPDAHRFQSQFRLAVGKIRAWVSDYYREPKARYEVETPTAIAGVRGTEFIAVYDATADFTDIVGLTDAVEVSGKLGVIGGAVQIGPQFYTRVEKGRFPSAPTRLDDALLNQYLEGVEIVGTGGRDGLNIQHPAVAGRLLGAHDVPGALAGPAVLPHGAERLVSDAPSDSLAARLSPDVRTNTQPLLDFQNTPPGRVPSGAVKVGF